MFRAHELARKSAALLFPNRCPFCGGICGISDLWHRRCCEGLPYIRDRVKPPAGLSELFAVCVYSGTARRAVLTYKEGSFVYAAEAFAALIAELLGEDAKRADLIVPVPSSLESLFERGYTPAGKIAHILSLRCKVPAKSVLRASGGKQAQKLLTAKQRRENVRNAFALKKSADVKGKCVLLIDDVCTTGSTLSACAELLRKAGAREVFGAVFARTRVE